MKALTVHQPWASAIARGAKRVETRSFWTKYRGPLAIHAAASPLSLLNAERHKSDLWFGVLGMQLATQPLGAVVAVCELTGCERVEDIDPLWLDVQRSVVRGCKARHWTERELGDFTPGRFGWLLADVRLLAMPVPVKGRQGLWDVADELLPRELLAPTSERIRAYRERCTRTP